MIAFQYIPRFTYTARAPSTAVRKRIKIVGHCKMWAILIEYIDAFLPRGVTTTGPDATPPPSYLPKLAGLGGGGVLAARPGGGGLCATHYYHMHTSRVCVCLGAWGYRGTYVIIAISRLCQEESLKGLKDQRHSTALQLSMGQKIWCRWRHGPRTAIFQTSGGGGGAGGCGIQGPGPAAPPGISQQKKKREKRNGSAQSNQPATSTALVLRK